MDFVTMANMLGGFTETQDANEGTQKICDKVKQEVEKKTQKTYEKFKAVKYRIQIVAGTNFLIKVDVGGYLHLQVLQELPSNGGAFVLLGVQEGFSKDDPLTPF